jgi:hypothetical protein
MNSAIHFFSEKGTLCRTHGNIKSIHEILLRKSEEKDNFTDLYVDGIIILKVILKK